MPNIIVELKNEMTRVRRILTRLDPVRRRLASNEIRWADENICRNDLAGMQESLADLKDVHVKPEEPPCTP